MNTENKIYQLMYISHAPQDVTDDQIKDILAVSRRNNMRDDISGILIYHRQMFMQVLEGDRSLVDQCYKRVVKDSRHGSPSIMWDGEVDTRSFPEWDMGFYLSSDLGSENYKSVLTIEQLKQTNGSILAGDSTVKELARAIIDSFN